MKTRTKYPVRNFILPPDRPKWTAPDGDGFDLLYLGWGRRYHGKYPPPRYRHPGWLYIFLDKGSPTYLINESSIRPSPKSLIVVHPECAFGANDVPSGCCSWLLWLWRDDPIPFSVPSEGYKIFSFSDDEIVALKHLHSSCRLEVSSPDNFTTHLLGTYRTSLDILIARHMDRNNLISRDTYLVEMAINWLRLNPTSRQPVPSLCEYLQISAATLTRLFRRHLKVSPARHHQELRMLWAREQMQNQNKSAKEVAYSLGFHHPGDFSRAYKRMFNISPMADRDG